MRITNCKVNHLLNPIGFEMKRTVFSWLVSESKGKRQESARITVSLKPDMSVLIADTGFAQLDSMAASVNVALTPRTRYFWQVTVRSDIGEEATSELQYFETGKMDEPWAGKWIKSQDAARHPVFRKKIEVKSTPVNARLYICGLGLYEAEINGCRVGDEYLTPYSTNYEEWVQYQTYDVTQALKTGGELAVTVGRGWYSARFGYISKVTDKGLGGDDFRLIAEVHLDYADGTHEVIATDEQWFVTRSRITDSSIYDGETYDDTLPDTASEGVSTVSAKLPAERYSPSVRIQERLKPVELIKTPAGEYVFDIGQNMTGIFELRVHGVKAGALVHIQVGEVLQNGCFYRDNLRSAKAEYNYISDGTDKTIRPHFTFYGFRYVKVEGIVGIGIDDLEALVLYSDIPLTGTLTTGHEKLNRLIKNVEWGQKDNFLDVPTDCPQRDERMGWTGDAQVFSATACYLRDCYAFYRKFLHDMASEQKNLDGMVPNVVPAFAPKYRETACVWGDAVTIIPWNVYNFYGDITILEDCFEQMKDWVEYIRREDGDNQGWKHRFHYGDWLALDHPNHKPDQCLGGTEVGYIAYVYYMQSAEITAKVAKLLGKTADADKYAALAEKLRKSIVHEYFAPGGRCCVDTQTGLLLAIRHNLAPDPKVCVERLLYKLKENEGRLQTGFVGTYFLCPILTAYGETQEAWRLMLNEEYPGWLYEVNLGATTIWERWNSMDPDGSVSSTGMNSFNHYAFGSIAEWLFGDAAGLRFVTPGFRHARIAPNPSNRIHFADLSYNSAAGTWRVWWEAVENKHINMKITVPFGCTADVVLPFSGKDTLSLDAGEYEFSYDTVRPITRIWTLEDSVNDVLTDKKSAAILDKHFPGYSRLASTWRDYTLRELFARRLNNKLPEGEPEALLRDWANQD